MAKNNRTKTYKWWAFLPIDFVATLLFLAGLLKLIELSWSYQPLASVSQEWFTKILVATEWALAIWLFSRKSFVLSRLVAFTVFCGFVVFNIWSFVEGKDSCGCFGFVEIHPLVSLTVDVFALLMLFIPQYCSQKFASTAAVPISLSLLGLFGLLITQPQTIPSFLSANVEAGESIYLDTDSWPGQFLPIANYIDNETDWKNTSCLLILYRADCSKCWKFIEQLPSDTSHQFIFLEIGANIGAIQAQNRKGNWWKLDDSFDWQANIPTLLEVENGIVVGVNNF